MFVQRQARVSIRNSKRRHNIIDILIHQPRPGYHCNVCFESWMTRLNFSLQSLFALTRRWWIPKLSELRKMRLLQAWNRTNPCSCIWSCAEYKSFAHLPGAEAEICEIVCCILDESQDPLEGDLTLGTNWEKLEIFHVGSDI